MGRGLWFGDPGGGHQCGQELPTVAVALLDCDGTACPAHSVCEGTDCPADPDCRTRVNDLPGAINTKPGLGSFGRTQPLDCEGSDCPAGKPGTIIKEGIAVHVSGAAGAETPVDAAPLVSVEA